MKIKAIINAKNHYIRLYVRLSVYQVPVVHIWLFMTRKPSFYARISFYKSQSYRKSSRFLFFKELLRQVGSEAVIIFSRCTF